MFKLLCPIPRKVFVAVSGGLDSMAALDFLARSHDVTILHFIHDPTMELKASAAIRRYTSAHGLTTQFGYISDFRPQLPTESQEEYWRIARYNWLENAVNWETVPDARIVVAHHLDDAMETWIWGAANGQTRLPKIKRGRIIRPFLATPKSELFGWAMRQGVLWANDPDNKNMKRTRNFIRANVVDMFKQINPGFDKVIRKKLLAEAEILKSGVDNDPIESYITYIDSNTRGLADDAICGLQL